MEVHREVKKYGLNQLVFFLVNSLNRFDFGNHSQNGLFNPCAEGHRTHAATAAGAMEAEFHNHVLCNLHQTHVAIVGFQVWAQLIQRIFNAGKEL